MTPETNSKQYIDTTIGPLKIPYIDLADFHNNPLGENQVHIKKIAGKYTIPDKNAKEYVISEIEKAKKEDETKCFFDGPMLRFNNYSYDKDTDHLTIYVQPTSFFTHKFTNLSLDEDVIWDMVREKGPDYSNLDDGLANPIGTEVVMVTKDNHTVIFKRRSDLAQYPGLYGIASGFVDYENDNYNPFNTQERILEQQLGVEGDIEELKLIGIGRAGDDRHSELSFYAKINQDLNELSIPPSKHEKTIPIEFTPEALAEYLAKTVDKVPRGAVKRGDTWIDGKTPKWVPAQADAMNKALRMNYTPKRVDEAISDEFNRLLKPIA